jgi:hypothetical protein
MRRLPLPLVALLLASACSSSPAAEPGGAAAPQVDAGTELPDAGDEGDGGSSPGFSYAPAGCGYQVQADGARAEQLAYALDDGSLGAAPEPQRVRLGLGGSTKLGDPDYADPARTVAITWDTDVATKASRVLVGKSPDALTEEHTGFSYVLPGSVPMRVHHVHVCGGEPSTTWYYKVGGGPAGQEVWGPVQSFTTAPAPGAADAFTVGVSGDSRDSLDVVWPLVQGRMRDASPRFQVFTGDSVLLATPDSENEYARWLDGAWKATSGSAGGDSALGNLPLYAIGGNHENLQAQWLANFAFPGDDRGGFFFSFDAGAAHFIAIDDNPVSANQSATQPGAQEAILAFLKADLAAADARRATVPWIVVFHHRGELSTSNHGDDSDMKRMRGLLMPLWDQYHVDLVLNGHDHDYERSTPATWSGTAPVVAADPAHGTTYVVCAGAGAGSYATGDGSQPYSAVRARFEGTSGFVGLYGLLDVSPSALKWTAYGLRPSGSKVADDGVIDTFSIAK